MSGKSVQIQHDGEIAVLTLNRPEVNNVLNRYTLDALLAAFLRLRDDESVHGILLTGAGKNFCAGADIGEMLRMTPLEAGRFAELGQKVMFAAEKAGKPVIAAVRGAAFGGGLELAMACDFIVAAETALFAAPEIRLGIIPGFGGTQRLPRLIGKSKAKEMIFTGARIRAREALDIGLVNRLAPEADLLPQAAALLKKICSRGLLSLKLAKEVIDAGYDVDLRNACLMERDAFAVCFSTEDQKEGMTAFVEKREARFKGR
ncbi:MAG: enoyl-CoA hydratase-related protein [Geobacteraceae bacterium]|nr:enoyl-CoA hydratase-related protein [Geobacteraceae bacterium]